MGIIRSALVGRRIASNNKKFAREFLNLPAEIVARVVVRAMEVAGQFDDLSETLQLSPGTALLLSVRTLEPESLTKHEAAELYGKCSVMFAVMDAQQKAQRDSFRRAVAAQRLPPDILRQMDREFALTNLARRLLQHRVFMTASYVLHDRDWLISPALQKALPLVDSALAEDQRIRNALGIECPDGFYEAAREMVNQYVSTYPSL